HRDFVRAGATLDAAAQNRLRAINEELSELSTAFQQNLLADTNDSAVMVDDVEELDGMSDEAIAAAAEAARSRGAEGKYVLDLVLPTAQPCLASLTNRPLRERVMRASLGRGSNGNAYDNTSTVLRMAALRAERARLLGYPDHATYVLADRTAQTPQALDAMLEQVVPAAMGNVAAEADALQAAIDEEAGGFAL